MSTEIKLPKPRLEGSIALETVLHRRRSIRRYLAESLDLEEVAQMLWAAQGITDSRGLRSSPSAGALYPLETYVAAANVNNLQTGIYKYNNHNHTLHLIYDRNPIEALYQAGLRQGALRNAAVIFALTAVYARMTSKYRQRGIRYVDMEAGHAAQNLCLQAVALGLGSVLIGAFNDKQVKQIVAPDTDEQPLYLIPVGRV